MWKGKQKMNVKGNIEAGSFNHFCSGKTINIIYAECVFVDLAMQHAKCMLHIVFSSMACLPLEYLPTLSYKQHDFRKKKFLNTKCIFLFSLQLLSETFLIQRRTERGMTKNVYCSSCKVPDTLMRLK